MKRRNFWLWYSSLPKVNDVVMWSFDKDNEIFPGPFRIMDRVTEIEKDQCEVYYILKQIFTDSIIRNEKGLPRLFHWGLIKSMQGN